LAFPDQCHPCSSVVRFASLFQLSIFGNVGDFWQSIRPPPPPIPIPIWRGFQRHHPNSSQIGVEFSDLAPFGVGLTRLRLGFFNYPITKLLIYQFLWPSACVLSQHPCPTPMFIPFRPKMSQGVPKLADGSQIFCISSNTLGHRRHGRHIQSAEGHKS